ncbi:MAG: hypothetical protein ACHQ6V_15805, partial [Myxococcota bacterium]
TGHDDCSAVRKTVERVGASTCVNEKTTKNEVDAHQDEWDAPQSKEYGRSTREDPGFPKYGEATPK